MAFVSTLNKDTIRSSYDEQIVKNFGKDLSYFGLPGSEILDLKEWRECLEYIIAVEWDEIAAQQLLDNVFQSGLNLEKFQLLHGDIDDILIKGTDDYGIPIKFPFNLVNLDYQGGILYKDMRGRSKRIRAIECLFERQREAGKNFLLFFTFNSRNRDVGEFTNTINTIEEHLAGYSISSQEVEGFFDWYRNSRYDYKIKIYVLYLIDALASSRQFKCKFHPPVTYLGSGNVRMIHFAFYLEWIPTIRPGLSNILEILNTRMKQVEKGKMSDLQLPILEIRKK